MKKDIIILAAQLVSLAVAGILIGAIFFISLS